MENNEPELINDLKVINEQESVIELESVIESTSVNEPESVVKSISVIESIENEFLNNLIQKFIEDKDFINKINLNQKNLNVISFIFKNHPEILKNIYKNIKKITEDKAITLNDIPEIILLCKDIFNLYSESNKIKLTKIEIIEFIKNIVIFILFKSDLVKMNDSDKDLILNLINLSIKLLETKINVKKTCVLKFW